MDVKEKLVELLNGVIDGGFKWHSYSYESGEQLNNDEIASHLIDHGVTVQEWISVYDRLPQEDGAYLVTANDFGNSQRVKIRWFAKDGETVDKYDLAGQKYVWYFYDSECGYASTKSVTHWMPLPQPPKGE